MDLNTTRTSVLTQSGNASAFSAHSTRDTMLLAGPPDRQPTPGASTRRFGTWRRRHGADQTFAVEVDIPSWLCDERSRTVAGRQPADDTDLLFLSDEGKGINHSNFGS